MNISVVSYDQSWPEAFALEADQLNSVLSSTLLQIHHIGSTAIPDILAKPIIDILIEADALESIDRKNRSLEALGYEAKGEYGISGRRYFQKKRIKWAIERTMSIFTNLDQRIFVDTWHFVTILLPIVMWLKSVLYSKQTLLGTFPKFGNTIVMAKTHS